MDPQTIGLFASLVGLLADFSGSRSDARVLDYHEFLQWLIDNGHADIRSKIEANHATTIGIKATLAEGRLELLEKLSSIEKSLAALSVDHGAIGQVAASISTALPLSKQSIALLKAFEEVAANKAVIWESLDGLEIVLTGGARNGKFSPSEQRFFNDDVHALCALGFLRTSVSADSTFLLQLTRLGSVAARSAAVQSVETDQ